MDVVVNSPSPKSNLKLVKTPVIVIVYLANIPVIGLFSNIKKSKTTSGQAKSSNIISKLLKHLIL